MTGSEAGAPAGLPASPMVGGVLADGAGMSQEPMSASVDESLPSIRPLAFDEHHGVNGECPRCEALFRELAGGEPGMCMVCESVHWPWEKHGKRE